MSKRSPRETAQNLVARAIGSDNANERATCAAKACKLIAEHKLLEEPEREGIDPLEVMSKAREVAADPAVRETLGKAAELAGSLGNLFRKRG